MRLLYVLGILSVLLTNVVRAEPWTRVDDRLLRSDIELLADVGVLRGPVSTWPLNWRQIRGALRSSNVEDLPPHARDAFLRIRRQAPGMTARSKNWGVEARVSATNEQALIRGFGAQARGDYDVQGRFIGAWGGTTLSVGFGVRDDDFSRLWHLDDSYLSQEVGNWILYAGTIQHWWGPGWTSALIQSTSARPFPKLGIKRNSPDPFESKWLSWLGPWSFDAYIGINDESGLRFEDHVIAGIRGEVQPFKGVTLGFKRALELCGDDRPCGFNTWFDALVAIGDRDNTGTLDEPGNQMAGFDLRYGNTIGNVSYSLYTEIVGEDEDNWLVGAYATLWGMRLSGPWGDNGARWETIVEYSDTLANRSFFDPNRPNVIYQNFIYNNGWRYRGRSVGASQDNDTRLITVTGHFTDTKNRFYRLTLHHADLNEDGRGAHTITANAETINILEGEARIPTPLGDFGATIRIQDDQPNTRNESKGLVAVEMNLLFRF